MSKLTEYLNAHRFDALQGKHKHKLYFIDIVPLVDGNRISIQASAGFSCIPKEDLLDINDYLSFECRANFEEPLLEEYDNDYVQTYVPLSVLEAVVEKHGGIDETRIILHGHRPD